MKFICVNDNMKDPSTDLVQELESFFLSLFPLRSQFELPEGERNPTLYLDEYMRLRQSRRAEATVENANVHVMSLWRRIFSYFAGSRRDSSHYAGGRRLMAVVDARDDAGTAKLSPLVGLVVVVVVAIVVLLLRLRKSPLRLDSSEASSSSEAACTSTQFTARESAANDENCGPREQQDDGDDDEDLDISYLTGSFFRRQPSDISRKERMVMHHEMAAADAATIPPPSQQEASPSQQSPVPRRPQVQLEESGDPLNALWRNAGYGLSASKAASAAHIQPDSEVLETISQLRQRRASQQSAALSSASMAMSCSTEDLQCFGGSDSSKLSGGELISCLRAPGSKSKAPVAGKRKVTFSTTIMVDGQMQSTGGIVFNAVR